MSKQIAERTNGHSVPRLSLGRFRKWQPVLSHSTQMAKVLIIQGQIKTYRVPFFIRLQEALQVDGIDLKVAYSPPSESEFIKRDNADLPNAFSTKVPGSWAVSERILYQPLLHEIAASGLVIVEHANKHFLNHL